VATATEAITNGGNDLDEPPRNATVFIQSYKSDGSEDGFCTGSLVTSIAVLTAVHCNIHQGDTVYFGAGSHLSGGSPRAIRTVTSVVPNISSLPSKASFEQRARDVAIVQFSPPMTMDASPKRPSFTRPTLTASPLLPQFAFGAIDGGTSGFGDVPVPLPGGGFELVKPPIRQVAYSTQYGVVHYDVGGGYAVWLHVAETDLSSGEPHTGHGDSGGPLFRWLTGEDQDARDVLGVSSGSAGPDNCWGLGKFSFGFCDEDHTSDIYADITAPSMKAWIESVLNPNKTNNPRWIGETDYTRHAFGTPGDPSNDPGCDVAQDPDCDLVTWANDSCAHDYNPDQINSDDPVDPANPSSHDPGDICDRCVLDLVNGANCNDDAEVLKYGPRPHLLEDDVVGNAMNPQPGAIVSQVVARYHDDRCDLAPCTQLGAHKINLDQTVYGLPDQNGTGCATPVVGGTCVFAAKTQIQHDGRWDLPPAAGANGGTGYLFCKCGGPFGTQAERLVQCFNGGPHCPSATSAFKVTPGLLAEVHADPPFTTLLGTSEVGTSDEFSYEQKTKPPTFGWKFEQDVQAITGMPNPSLPLTDATAAAIQIDGLLWSNVRSVSGLPLPSAADDLNSFWLGMSLRVGYGVVGGHYDQVGAAGCPWWQCQNCPFGLVTPWMLVTQPALPPLLFGMTETGVVDITSFADSAVLSLLRSTGGAPGPVLVTAGEHHDSLARLAAPFAPRLVVANLSTLTFIGAIGQDEVGNLLPVRGRIVGSAPLAMRTCWDTNSISCASGPGGGSAAAALSAVHGSLYVLRRATGSPTTSLHVFDVLTETWSEVPLNGATLPNTPLALSYDAQADALFAVDRANGQNGDVRLMRIRLDGTVDLVGQGFGFAHGDAEVSLTTSEDGTLVMTATRAQPRRFRVVEIQAFTTKAKVVGQYQAKGELRAAPFLTDRALHLLVADPVSGVKAVEVAPSELGAPHSVHDFD
jgi:Trypsin